MSKNFKASSKAPKLDKAKLTEYAVPDILFYGPAYEDMNTKLAEHVKDLTEKNSVVHLPNPQFLVDKATGAGYVLFDFQIPRLEIWFTFGNDLWRFKDGKSMDPTKH